MRDNGSLRGRLLGNLALLLVVLMLASGLSAYWNGREAADTATIARCWLRQGPSPQACRSATGP